VSSAGRALAVVALLATPAGAHRFDERVEVYGYSQVWLTLWEQMEDAEGLLQNPSRDEAANALSGLSLAKLRVGVRLAEPSWDLSLHVQARLDHEPALLDADAAWSPRPWFSLHVGQLKVPGTHEALTEDGRLDFILRSDITTALADYSLSKAEHRVSLLYGSVSSLRDLGIAAKGELGGGALRARYFVMVGNGLGANLYFGGNLRKEYFITNKAQLYTGARVELEVDLLGGVATLGAFASRNRHDNIVFNSGRVVYDLDRRMAGGDLRVAVPAIALRLHGLGGIGEIAEDFSGDGYEDLHYRGGALAAVWDGGRFFLPEGHALELAARVERFEHEVDESGLTVRRDRATVGVTYTAPRVVRAQLDAIVTRTDDPGAVAGDLDDDVLLGSLQIAF
jgi:hypothetical protein